MQVIDITCIVRFPWGIALPSFPMSPVLSVAASLAPDIRQDIGIQVLARTEPISHLADNHQVSRKFIYQQGDQAQQALDEPFAPSKS